LAPVLKALSQLPKCPPISVDTYKAEAAERALNCGASIINDIYAGRKEPAILKIAAKYNVPLILMHMQGEPNTMQKNPCYDDVVEEVREFLLQRAQEAMDAGVQKEMIILDPGLGFGKNAQHNLTLLNHFEEVMPQGFHSMIALSRKAFLGRIIGDPEPLNRDLATAVASAIAVAKGAEIVRVHNVAPSRQASDVAFAVRMQAVSAEC
jgi:dihydropteroate synthase